VMVAFAVVLPSDELARLGEPPVPVRPYGGQHVCNPNHVTSDTL